MKQKIKNNYYKGSILLIVVIVLSLASYFDLEEHLTFESLKLSKTALSNFYDKNPYLMVFYFFIFVVVTTTFSIPGGAVITLAAGAVFGFWLGLLIVSVGSTIGCTVAFLATRYLFKDYIQKRFIDKSKHFKMKLKEEGPFYLFSLRLIPVVPFFVVNTITAIAPIGVRKYTLISALGMFPGTAVFANMGTKLAQLKSIDEIWTLEFIGSLVLIAVFPFISRYIVHKFK